MMIKLQNQVLRNVLSSFGLLLVNQIIGIYKLLFMISFLCVAYRKPHRAVQKNRSPVNGIVRRIEYRSAADVLEIEILTIPILHAMTMRFMSNMISHSIRNNCILIRYEDMSVSHYPFLQSSINSDRMHEPEDQEYCKTYGFMYAGGRTVIKFDNWLSKKDKYLCLLTEGQSMVDGETLMMKHKNNNNENGGT